jgi:hypothetical protein
MLRRDSGGIWNRLETSASDQDEVRAVAERQRYASMRCQKSSQARRLDRDLKSSRCGPLTSLAGRYMLDLG